MVLLSRPVLFHWNLFHSNPFTNFRALNVSNSQTAVTVKGIFEKLTALFSSGYFWCHVVSIGMINVVNLILQRKTYSVPRKVANSTVETSYAGENYIHRPELEAKLERAFTRIPDGFYYIVYGDNGVGKTELVTRIANGSAENPRKGVIRMSVFSHYTYQSMIRTILQKVCGEDLDLFSDDLVKKMKEVKEKFDIYPTIIFDVGCVGSEVRFLQDVRSLSKALAVACRCIIVLPNVYDVLEFGRDQREIFLFVDELSRQEAAAFLTKETNLLKDANDRDYVLNNIGTNPLCMRKLVYLMSRGLFVQEAVGQILMEAEIGLVAFPLQKILQALKDHPNGVSPIYFNKQKQEGIDLSDPSEVGAAMKKTMYNPIMYRMDLGQYQIISTAHRVALQSYTIPPSLLT